MLRSSPTICGALLLLLSGCGQGSAPDATADATTPASGTPAAPVISGRYPGLVNQAEAVQTNDDDHLHPIVVLKTSAGDITLRLDAEHAPVTVDNFLSYVEAGHYSGTVFHQVVQGYMILGGGLTHDLQEKPARTPIRNEAHNGLKNRKGAIAMARSTDEIDSSTCQFFINLGDNANLDHRGRKTEEYGYCVFGEVIGGMEIVEKIAQTPVKDQQTFAPAQTVSILSVDRMLR